MGTKKIQIKLTEDGKIFAETIGMKGQECIKYIDLLEKLLESETVDSNYKEEYFQFEETTTEQNKLKLKEE